MKNRAGLLGLPGCWVCQAAGLWGCWYARLPTDAVLPQPRKFACSRDIAVGEAVGTFMSEVETKPNLRIKGRLMSASEIERTLVRLAHEIVEKSNGSEGLVMIGIKRRGVPLAQRLAKLISTIEKHPVDNGMLDIQFYRDDLSTADVRPVVTPGAVGCEIVGKDVVL